MLKFKNQILLILVIVSLTISIMGVLPVSAGLFCGGMGTKGLQPKSKAPNFANAMLPQYGARSYSIDEMFGPSSYMFSIPFGSTDGDWLWRQENRAVEKDATSISSDAKQKLEQYGKDYNCSGFGLDGFFPTITSTSMSMTNSISTIIKGLFATLFNSEFICKDAASEEGGCVNLLGIYGGTEGGDGGLIGALSNGIFLPLSVIAFIFTAFYVLYEALLKRQFRLGVQSMLWALFVFVLGVFTMLRPWQVARFPQATNEVISNCLIAAMNGQSCMDTDSATINEDNGYVQSVCTSQFVGGDSNKNLQAQINGMTCMLSKSFTIDRWAQQQFGYSFDDLYTKDPPKNHEAYTNIEGSADDYCVNMYSTNSPITLMKNPNNIKMEPTKQVCNIALAYMSNTTVGDYGTKATMGDIIATATKDDAMWKAFTGGDRELMGTFALLAAIAAALSFIPVVVFGHVYSITATLLMVFAPIFLLFGIEPSRGRRIFLGWLESVLSSIMKYFATTLLALIMMVVYSAVMSTLKGVVVFISSVILCFTFYFYRKELVNMIGAVNMGGQKLSNKFGDAISKTVDKTKQAGTAVVGGAIGGAVASKVAGGKISEGMKQGIKEGVGMDMRRGNNMVAKAVRTGSRVDSNLKKEREKLEKMKRDQEMNEALQNAAKSSSENIVKSMGERTDMLIERDKDMNVMSKQNLIDANVVTINNNDLKEQIADYKNNNITRDKDEQEIEVSFGRAMEMTREAKSIERYVEQNNGSAEQARERMISDYMREEKQKMIDDYNALTKDEDIVNSRTPAELNKELENFLTVEGQRLEKLERTLRDNFKVIKDGENSYIQNIGLEKQVDTKTRTTTHNKRRLEKFRQRLYQNLDNEELKDEI